MRISESVRTLLLVWMLRASLWRPAVASQKKSENISCVFETGGEPYASGDEFMFCINYMPLMIKENAYLPVGRTTVIHQKFMWRIFENIGSDIIFQVANSSIYSTSVPFNRPQSKLAFPFLPLVITMDYGKVIDMVIEEINDICPNEEVQSGILSKFYKNSTLPFNPRPARRPK